MDNLQHRLGKALSYAS